MQVLEMKKKEKTYKQIKDAAWFYGITSVNYRKHKVKTGYNELLTIDGALGFAKGFY